MTPDELEELEDAIRDGIYGDDRMSGRTSDAAFAALRRLMDEAALLQAKLDCAEGRKAPAEGWEWFSRRWRKDSPSSRLFVEVRPLFHSSDESLAVTSPCAMVYEDPEGILDDPRNVARLEAETLYDCILAVEAWLKENPQ